jgi:hypothetical protein
MYVEKNLNATTDLNKNLGNLKPCEKYSEFKSGDYGEVFVENSPGREIF